MSRTIKNERITHHISSNKRTAGTNSDFTITLDEKLSRIRKVEVKTTEIPFSFYVVIAAQNNVLEYKVNGVAYNITVPEGNYSGTTFASQIQLLLDAQQGSGWLVNYNTSIYKIEFTYTGGTYELLSSVGSTMSDLIGLSADSGVISSGVKFTCQGISNLSGPNFILIRSNALTRPLRRRPLYNNQHSDVLYKAQVRSGPGTTLTDNISVQDPFEYPVRISLSTIDLRIEDEEENPIDLNNLPWSITLIYEIE
jgi:hypothetical protein